MENHQNSANKERFYYRHPEAKDLSELIEIEEICFPPNEACTRKNMEERLEKAADTWLLVVDRERDDRIMGFVGAVASSKNLLEDQMFVDASLHEPEGAYLIVVGLDMRPEYRHGGNASRLMERFIENAKNEGRKGVVLTCHDYLVPFYERFGYKNLGRSASAWGGEEWYDMRIDF